ncbi:hypothetical protein DSO57_1028300 [Entomophthora muscae]|uniref:Uncharacterized protein n=1 Tax=Entomophthora muscae TaxID=34485 RepID=A0ACC2SE45_9FUNG|nr:hypothetical protein DSO57_1028300 [Entomophthora muscae]
MAHQRQNQNMVYAVIHDNAPVYLDNIIVHSLNVEQRQKVLEVVFATLAQLRTLKNPPNASSSEGNYHSWVK